VLGPLPKLYRVIVTLTALVVCAAAGAWAELALAYPRMTATGAGVGLAVGAMGAYLMLHQPRALTRPAREHRHRLH
jgi:hypothetical protein